MKTTKKREGNNEVKKKIMEEFERKYGIDDDWDSELYQKTPSGWIEANSSVKQFLSSALDKVVEELVKAVFDMDYYWAEGGFKERVGGSHRQKILDIARKYSTPTPMAENRERSKK